MGFEPTISWATTRCLDHSATLTTRLQCYSTTKVSFKQDRLSLFFAPRSAPSGHQLFFPKDIICQMEGDGL